MAAKTSSTKHKMDAKTPPTKPKVSVKQLRILVNAIEANPSLYNAGKSDIVSFLNLDQWMDLAETLNKSLGGAQLVTVPDWKYVLRYWSANTKLKLAPDSKIPRVNPSLPAEEGQELAALEKRLYDFLQKEDAIAAEDEQESDANDEGPSRDGIKFVMQVTDPFESIQDENAAPGRKKPKKRTIELHEDDFSDLAKLSKKFRVIYDENVENPAEGPQEQILMNQMDRLQDVSRKLEGHISSIQSRIQMIKDMWKHRCGDN